jgi:hypothetical protein
MNGKIILRIAFCVLMMCDLFYGEAPDTLWTKRYDNPNYHSDDVGYSAEQTLDGGYILASSSWNGTDLDMWIIKTDSMGNPIWQTTWSGLSGGDDEPGCVRQTFDGGYILTGYTTRTGLANTDLELIKYSPTGTKQWERRYGVQGDWMSDFGAWVEQTPDSGYIITGMHSSPEGIWLIKTDQSGTILWQRTFSEGVSGNCVQHTSDNGYIICGISSTGDCLLKTDSLGNLLWVKYLGGSDMQKVFEIQDGYVILGNKNSDFWLIKADSFGNLIWEKTYGGSNTDNAYAMGLVNDGGYILTGRTFSFGAGESDIWVVRTDSLGDTLWTKTLGGIYDEWGMAVEQTQDNRYMVFGYTELGGTGSDDAWLIKLETDLVGIEETYAALPNKLFILQILPNPVGYQTQIRYQLFCKSRVNIAIFNILGEKVANIVNNEDKDAGSYCVRWMPLDAYGKRLPAGLYFCRLTVGKNEQIEKIILVR